MTGVVAAVVLIPGLATLAQTAASADSLPAVTVNDITKPRPTSGTAVFAFTVSLTHASNNPAYVNYSTADASARSTFDYQQAAGTLTFAPHAVSQTVSVTVNGTTLNTGDRYFRLNLSGATNATIQRGSGQATIVDTTLSPYLSVGDATVTQGAGVANNAVFAVHLTSPSANPVTVKYATSNGSAGVGVDYTATNGTLTFPPATTTQSVTVPITAVSGFQNSKNFYVSLSAPTNATIADGQGQATILNANHTAYITSDDVTIAEPASGTATVNVPVGLTSPSTFPVTVAWATSNGGAVAGTDYVAASGTVTIPANTTRVNVPLTVKASALASPQAFNFNMNSPSNGASFIRSSSVVTITSGTFNNLLSVTDTGVIAPATGTTTETFTVSLSPARAATVTVAYATSNISATAPTEYASAAGTLTFAPGQTTQTVSVTVNAAPTVFTDTYYALNLSSPTGGAVIQRGTGSGLIDANGLAPMVSVSTAAVTKPASGTLAEPIVVTLSGPSANTVTVNYATSDSYAVAGTDYQPAVGVLTFAPGITSQTVNVGVLGNTRLGNDLSYYFNLSSPTNAQIAGYSGLGIIQNPNRTPRLTINDVAVYKPRSATAPATMTVTLASASPNTVTVNYATSNGSATAGVDYAPANGTLTFAPNVVTRTVAVTINGNTLPTGDRNFYVSISSATNASIVSSSGVVTIIDSSEVPVLSVTSTAVQKPAAGSANAAFTLTVSPPSANVVTVNYATGNGNAVAGTHYSATAGTATFPAGSTTQTVNVPVTASTVHSGDVFFYLNLSAPTNARLGYQWSNTATIIDPTFVPLLTVDDAGVSKPASGTATEAFTVHLYPASPNTVTANYATSDGSAAGGTDYSPTSGTVTFAPGATAQTVSVSVNGNASSVPDRYFLLNLSSATNAQISGRSSAYGLIVDTVAPTSGLSYLTVQDAGRTKPNSGTATETFSVKLFPAPASPVNVNYATGDGSATAGSGDYVATRGTLTFNPGTTSLTVPVTVNGNTLPAPDKYFSMYLGYNTGPSNNFRSSSYGWILNNQPDTRLSVGPDLTINRGASGSQNVPFVVSLNAPVAYPVQVDYSTSDGAAVAPDGYSPASGTLTFAPGQTTQTVPVAVPGNPSFSGLQDFSFATFTPVNTTLGANRTAAYVYNLDTFTIRGKVVDQNGGGISNVTMSRSGNNQPTATTTTAADGTYAIANTLNGGLYSVTPTLAGSAFLPATTTGLVVRGADVTVPPYLGFAGIAITGQVTTSAGTALGGVTVTRSAGAGPTVTAVTTTQGYYAFANVASGTGYVLTPSLTGWTFGPTGYTVDVTGSTVSGRDFVAVQPASITGHVTTSAGVGVAGVTLTRSGGAQPNATVKTNSQGYYGFTMVPATAGGLTYTITPSLTGSTFTPTSASATVSTTADATGISFTKN